MRRLRTNLRFNKSLDGQKGLRRVGVGVDGNLLGLLIFFAFGVEFHLNLAFFTRLNGLFWALRNRATARPFAIVNDQRLGSGVGEFKKVRN